MLDLVQIEPMNNVCVEPPASDHPDHRIFPRAAQTDFQRRVYCLFGMPVDAVRVADVVTRIRACATARQRFFLATPNLNCYVISLHSAQYRETVLRSDLSTIDGQPLRWSARLMGLPAPEKVSGSTVFEQLRAHGGAPLSVYFLGSDEATSAAATARMNAAPSGLTCLGGSAPGFGSVQDMSGDTLLAHINASGADFLIVALGAHKGNAWIIRNQERLRIPVAAQLGAVINMAAGNISRAPLFVQNIGCEWLWRIKEEPALWRRYFHDGLAFLRLLATRLLPFLLTQRRLLPSQALRRPALVTLDEMPQATVLHLSGTWDDADLSTLRQSLAQAAARTLAIHIELQYLQFIDSATLGLILLLYGHQLKAGLPLHCHHATSTVARLFTLHCADYLLQIEPSSPVQ